MSHEYNTSDLADVILVAFRITLRDFVALNNISHYNLIMNRTHKNKAAFNSNQSIIIYNIYKDNFVFPSQQ